MSDSNMLNLPINFLKKTLLFLGVSFFILNTFADQAQSKFPSIERVNEGLFTFGDITIDQVRRIISLPAVCNQTSGLIEYGLVHDNGKLHESLFRTAVQPRLIHASLLLLKEKPAKNFFSRQNTTSKNRLFDIVIEWDENNTKVCRSISLMILNQTSRNLLQAGKFLFTGSKKVEGQYLAEMDGSIIAIYQDFRATINNTDTGTEFDDVWLANLPQMPPLDLPVTICLQLPDLE